MEFKISHSFETDVETLSSVLLDEEYQRSLDDIGSLKERHLMSQREEADGRLHRRVRCVLDINVSGVAKSLLGNTDPAWIEEAIWHPEKSRWDWVIHPEVAKELLDAKGTIGIRDPGDGTQRTVAGTVKVKVPVYGGKVEGWIVDGIERAYDEEATRLAAWLGKDRRPLQS
jgi:Protein of unknown function (DUF2505)